MIETLVFVVIVVVGWRTFKAQRAWNAEQRQGRHT